MWLYICICSFSQSKTGCELRKSANERREKITRTKWSRVVIVRTCEHGFYAETVQTIQVLFLKKQEDQSNLQLNIFSVAMQQLFSCVLQFKANMHKYTHMPSSLLVPACHIRILHDCNKSCLWQAQELHNNFYFSVPPHSPIWDI